MSSDSDFDGFCSDFPFEDGGDQLTTSQSNHDWLFEKPFDAPAMSDTTGPIDDLFTAVELRRIKLSEMLRIVSEENFDDDVFEAPSMDTSGPLEVLPFTVDLKKIKIWDLAQIMFGSAAVAGNVVDEPFDPPTMDTTGQVVVLPFTVELKRMKVKDVDLRKKFDCPVCLSEHFNEDGIVLCVNFAGDGDDNTTHNICVDCIRGIARSATVDSPIAAGGVGLPCVENGCKNIMLMSEFKMYLDPDIHSALATRMQHESIVFANMPDFVTCPGCSVGFCADSSITFYDCDCGRRQCRNCHRLYDNAHQGRTCDEMQRAEELAAKEHDIGPRLSEIVVRVCPRCRLQFTKESGCNKMTCRCGALICYLCNVIVADYTHFCRCGGTVGVGQACPRCHKRCPVHANAAAYDAEKIQRVRLEEGLG